MSCNLEVTVKCATNWSSDWKYLKHFPRSVRKARLRFATLNNSLRARLFLKGYFLLGGTSRSDPGSRASSGVCRNGEFMSVPLPPGIPYAEGPGLGEECVVVFLVNWFFILP